MAEELEAAAAKRVRSRFDDVVRRALAAERHRGAARLDLELFDRLHREPERQVPSFALDHGVRDRNAFDVHVGREVLAAHDVAPAADRLHAGHQEHEGRRIARTASVHHQRQRRVHVVADRLAEPGIRGRQGERSGGDEHLLFDSGDLQHDVEADDAEPVDDDAFAGERLEPIERRGDTVLTRRQRRQRIDARLCRYSDSLDSGGDVRGGDRDAGQRGLARVEHGALNGSVAANLGRGADAPHQQD